MVFENKQALAWNRVGDALRILEPWMQPQNNYRVNFNIAYSDGPLVLPPLPMGHTFVVTSSLMKLLTTRDLFLGLVLDNLHGHLAKLRVVCKSCVG